MNYPKISIITPSYNQAQYLEDTILSVLGQFYPNLEYMIYDGESTDGSVEIIKKYENNLFYWESKKDKGQSDAINKGFAKSTGDILMWLNSDDILMPNTLYFIANQFLEKGDGIYYGNCIHFEEVSSGVNSFGSNVKRQFKIEPLEISDPIIQPSTFWSRKVWVENGKLDEDLHYGFDWEWFLRAKSKGISFHVINKTLSLYRIHERHKTSNGGEKRKQELLKIYEPKYQNLYELIKKEKLINSKLERVIYLFCKYILKINFTSGILLKIIKKNKYKAYTINEINCLRLFLGLHKK